MHIIYSLDLYLLICIISVTSIIYKLVVAAM